MSKFTIKQIGSGGFWKVINERKDSSVVKQKTPLSCVAAVGEMLLQLRGIETTESLARLLNGIDKSNGEERWHGIIISIKHLENIAGKSSFGAVLREGNPLGHLVLVEGLTENLLNIKDPWDGTIYQMTTKEFLKVWNGEVVLKWNL